MLGYFWRGVFFQYFGVILYLSFFGLIYYSEALAQPPVQSVQGNPGTLVIESSDRVLSSGGQRSSSQPGGMILRTALPDKSIPEKYTPKLREFILEGNKTAYLTFDDGPSEETGPILDILKERGIKASFFVIGTQVEEHPELLKRIKEEGHTIGNHTYSHRMEQIYQSPQAFFDSVAKNNDLITRTVGYSPSLVRAPGGTGGRFTFDYYRLLDSADYIVHDWNVDSRDSQGTKIPASVIVKNILSQTASKERAVVLLHDSIGKETTVEALRSIIDGLKEQGFTLAPLNTKVYPYLASIKK